MKYVWKRGFVGTVTSEKEAEDEKKNKSKAKMER